MTSVCTHKVGITSGQKFAELRGASDVVVGNRKSAQS